MTTPQSSFSGNILFLSHGGGPLPLLGDVGHREMVDVLVQIAKTVRKPSAIIVVSAHWEAPVPTVTHAASPEIIYDYHGFPEESYEIEYPAPGFPQLAESVFNCLNTHFPGVVLDDRRGFDHGLFVPLKIMYPDADIPCIQLSLLRNLDPANHLKMGESLNSLELKDLLVIGSGFSFHNMREFFRQGDPESRQKNETFESWLIETCSSANLDEIQRANRLAHWEEAPHARFCHPREEHLLPLHVCYGLARKPCADVFEFDVLGKKASAYLW